jgi:hypothetical protein
VNLPKTNKGNSQKSYEILQSILCGGERNKDNKKHKTNASIYCKYLK